jgi:sugar phosphate isomerase/epimerase
LKTCLAIQSLRSCTLEEAAGIARALGFEAMDLDGVMDTTLSRQGILEMNRAEVKRVKDLGLVAPNIHWTFGPASLYPVINDPDPAIRAENKEQIKRLADFCHEADIFSILVLPGMFLPGQSAADAHKLSAESLNEFQIITNEAGIALMVEPHATSAFESPDAALWLAKQVPDMGIVLDCSHFVVQGYTQPDVDRLIPFTRHVHLRQAKSGLLQTRLEEGTINFALLLDGLRQVAYDGYLCVEYVHQDFIGATNVDIITETVKMRDFINAHLRAAHL